MGTTTFPRICVPAACLLACCLAALPAAADDIYVTTVADTYDEYCTQLTIPPWSCSLREAVALANFTPGKDTIHVPAGTYVLSREGVGDDLAVTGDLDIIEDVDIKGAGAGVTIIDGNSADRVFHMFGPAPLPDPSVQLFDLTVQNGVVQPGSPESDGGGVKIDYGELYLWRCEVRSNTSRAYGSGISARSTTVLIVDSTLADNGPATLDPNDPTPFWGGAIHLEGGTALVIRSTLHSNRAHQGSAIYCKSATLNTANTTIANNLDDSYSGALHLRQCDAVIDSTTFSGNTPYGISGSGVMDPGQLTLRNTYINDDCNFVVINYCPTSEGGNVEGHASCCLTNPTDVEFAPNQVGPLGDHGGHTWTMLPLTHTILMDNSDADANCQPEDQRGISRPQEGYFSLACDIGAVEFGENDLTIFADGFESGDLSAWQ